MFAKQRAVYYLVAVNRLQTQVKLDKNRATVVANADVPRNKGKTQKPPVIFQTKLFRPLVAGNYYVGKRNSGIRMFIRPCSQFVESIIRNFTVFADTTENSSRLTVINTCLLYTSPSPRD